MNNLFLRLYILIVATVVVVGISLDFAWQYFEEQNTEEKYDHTLINIVSVQLEKLEKSKLDNHINLINNQFEFDNEFSILRTNDKLVGIISKELNNQDLFFIESGDDILGFKYLKPHDLILQFKHKKLTKNILSRNIFIMTFYALIAIVVFYWIWPLSKDLNRLENSINQFDQQQWLSKVNLPATSSINHLAKAYNTLLGKIKLLIETQQAMSHSISHELRTPLARVRFSLQMAEESNSIDEVKQQIESIKDDISEMNELINELLNFASLENVSATVNLEKGDLNTLIETLLNRLRKNHPDKEIIFERNSKRTNILCDRYLMERAIQNLVVNACKFSIQKILITFRESDEQYQVLVEDDGLGVPAESKNKIFDSFVQLDNKNKNKGFGLGLAIVRRIMALHSGSSRVESSSLGGAKFILSWSKNMV